MLSLSVSQFSAPPLRASGPLWVVVALLVGGGCTPPGAVSPAVSSKEDSAFPSSLRAAYIASVQAAAAADPAYAVDASARTLRNPRQQLAARLDAAGLSLSGATARGELRAAVALKSYGCADQPVTSTAARPRAQDNRVEYVRDGLTEWYVNGPLGLEQGFTLDASPRCAAGLIFNLDWDTELSPALSSTAATAREGQPKQRFELRDREGQLLLAYSELYAYDAAHRRLPAELVLLGRRLAIRVDDRDAQYPVTVDPLIWTQQQKLLSSDGASGDALGTSVAIAGDTALIGDPLHDYFATNQGAAYVFVRSNGQWTQQQRLLASDYFTGDLFGTAVALAGDTAVIGAPSHAAPTSGSGQAYVFVRSGTTWTEQARLAVPGALAGDALGRSVAVEQDTAVVGAPSADLTGQADAGAAYVFFRSGTTWAMQQRLTAMDALAADAFGSAVAVAGNTVVAGAPRDDTAAGTDAGSAYVFLRTGTTWAQQMQLLAADGAATDLFGSSVGLAADTAVAGAPQADTAMGANAGAAYVFLRTGTSWAQQQKLTAADGAAGDSLGAAVAIAADTAVLGAPQADSALGGADSGAAYVWTRTGATWSLQMKLTAADGVTGDQLGGAVAIAADSVAVGAPQRSESAVKRGVAYAFFRGQSTGDPCTTPSQCVSNICINNTCRSGKLPGLSCLSAGECATNFCVDGVCCDTACGGSQADCQACSVATGATVSGTCSVLPAGRQCRAKANECDLAELCDGAAPLCPGDVGLGEGMPCAFGTCRANVCTAEVPLAYVPPAGGSAVGCALSTGHSSSAAVFVATALALLALALLLGARSRAG